SLIQSFEDYQTQKKYSDQILLFPDTFALYFEPRIWEAVEKLFNAIGHGIFPGMGVWRLWDHYKIICCGRPMISNGLLDKAVQLAALNTNVLFSWAAAGKPIVACEPSCILTIKDDYP